MIDFGGEWSRMSGSFGSGNAGVFGLCPIFLGHWEVENCLHLQKDYYWDEDNHICGF